MTWDRQTDRQTDKCTCGTLSEVQLCQLMNSFRRRPTQIELYYRLNINLFTNHKRNVTSLHFKHRRQEAQLSQKDRAMQSFVWLNILISHSGSLNVSETGTIRKRGYAFLFALHSNYGSILYHFRDKTRYWSKIAMFSYPLHSMPLLWGPRWSVAILFGVEKVE